MSTFDLVIVANSPGEISALVVPLVKKAAREFKEARLYVVIPPCQYSSGKEVEYLSSFKEIQAVISSDEYKKWLLSPRPPRDITFNEKGAVLFLGGDLAHAAIIAKKLKFKAYAYVLSHIGWERSYTLFFVPDSQCKDRFAKKLKAKEKLKIVGDLMVDSLTGSLPDKTSLLNTWKLDPERPIVGFMPGSRMWQVSHTMPIYNSIAQKIKEKMPGAQLILSVAPYLTLKQIEPLAGIHLYDVMAPLEVISTADLAITIPGTNTAQLAIMGTPSVVVFPLDNPDVIPLEGLAHYLCAIPVLGFLLKRLAVFLAAKKPGYYSIPNIKARKEIYPEYRGKIDPSAVAGKMISLLKNREQRRSIAEQAKQAMGQDGAAGKIIEAVKNETVR